MLNQIKFAPRRDLDKPSRCSDFDICIHLDSKTILVPVDLYNFILSNANVQNAADLMNFVNQNGRLLADFLKWSMNDIEVAIKKLLGHIYGVTSMSRPKTGGKKP